MELMVSKLRTIEIRYLRVFAEVARSGGITAAAQTLGIAKSAASKDLSELEAALKVRLYERSSRRVALTKEGAMLLPKAQSILAEVDQLMEDALDEKKQVRGIVRISASPEFGTFLAEKFLPLLSNQYPELKVLMRLEYQMDDLHDPNIDLAFRLGSISDDRLVGRHIGEFARHIVCSPAFAKKHPIRKPQELSHRQALLFSDIELSSEWELKSAVSGRPKMKVPVQGNLGIRSFSALLNAAEAGLGIARLPSFVANAALAKGSLVNPIANWQATPSKVYVAYRTSVMRIGRVRAVIDAAELEIPKLLQALSKSK
jgi:DNA-binding transcriptional LysR family regulator